MKRVLTVILFALTSLLLLSSVQAKGNENSNPTGTTNQPNFVPGELLVQFRSNSVDEDEPDPTEEPSEQIQENEEEE